MFNFLKNKEISDENVRVTLERDYELSQVKMVTRQIDPLRYEYLMERCKDNRKMWFVNFSYIFENLCYEGNIQWQNKRLSDRVKGLEKALEERDANEQLDTVGKLTTWLMDSINKARGEMYREADQSNTIGVNTYASKGVAYQECFDELTRILDEKKCNIT